MGALSARRLRAALAAALLVTLLPLATAGCFGSFQLTRKIYSFNRGISSDKWIRWITFLVLTVVGIRIQDLATVIVGPVGEPLKAVGI